MFITKVNKNNKETPTFNWLFNTWWKYRVNIKVMLCTYFSCFFFRCKLYM